MKFMQLTIAGAVIALLAGCGGGGSSGGSTESPQAQTGKFIDSAVAGLGYTCGSFSGTTDAAGTFNYEAGSACTFKIGGITLGSASAAPTLTPVSLVSGAVDESHPVVANVSRLLISLDADNNPANGLEIASSVTAALASSSLDVTDTANFDALASAAVAAGIPGRTLVSTTAATSHLNATLLGLLAGSYSCSFSGGDSGTVNVTIANGTVSGSGTSRYSAGFAVGGQVVSSGDTTLTAGGTSTGGTFTGKITSEGTGSGSWQAGSASGTWTCSRA